MHKEALSYMADEICSVEFNSKGRLATSIEDILLRSLVAHSLNQKSIRILEIGSLFGIGLFSIYNSIRYEFNAVKLFCIDRLDGYYNDSVNDPSTNQVINEEVIMLNKLRTNIPDDDFVLIKENSDSDTAVNLVKNEPLFDLLIIDADHTYAGVKSDYINYKPFVRKGGYIIFDDYNKKKFPGVVKAVNYINNQKKYNITLIHNNITHRDYAVAKKIY